MDLEELRAFLAVVDTGSFSAAAERLNFARATLRKRVDQFEAASGVTLFQRAADRASVTRAGERLAEKGRYLLRETRAVIDAVRALDSQDDLLTLEVPVGLPHGLEQNAHRAFKKAAPSLRFRILYTDGHFDPDSSSHFSFHHGDAPAVDPRWHHTRVAKLRVGLAASPKYIETHGQPETLEDLRAHSLFWWERPGTSSELLPLAKGCEDLPHPVLRPALLSPNAAVIRSFASAGDGIALIPLYRLSPLLEPKEPLVPLLSQTVRGDALVWMSVRRDAESGAIGVLASALARLIKAALSPLTPEEHP